MIGVLTQKNPFSSKKRWIAFARRVPHPRRRADHVRARPQMRDLAQVFQGVRLWLDRIGVRVLDPADHAQRARLHLEGLPLRRRRHDHPRRLDRAAGRELQDLVGVIGQGVRRDDLHRVERRPVRYVHERNPRLRVAPRAHPAFDCDRRILRRLAGQDLAPAELSLVHRSYRMDHPVEYGVPGRTRTCDPQFRKLLLYPPELRGPNTSKKYRVAARLARKPGCSRGLDGTALVCRVHSVISLQRRT